MRDLSPAFSVPTGLQSKGMVFLFTNYQSCDNQMETSKHNNTIFVDKRQEYATKFANRTTQTLGTKFILTKD